jgi:hypothetical protein
VVHRRFTFLIHLFLVLAIASSASAAVKSWTNGDGDNQWCNGLNWTGGGPTLIDTAEITGTPNDTVIVGSGCAGQVGWVDWDLNADQTFEIESGGSLEVQGTFDYSGGSETATIAIGGNLTIGGDGDQAFRAPDKGRGIVNILAGANVFVYGGIRGADESGYWELNMSGGDVNCGFVKIGEDGDANFCLTGGRFATTAGGSGVACPAGTFEIQGRGGAEINVQIDGGAQLYVGGEFRAPSGPATAANINLNDGEINVGSWQAAGLEWIVDINNNGLLRIRGGGANTKERVEQWIASGQIIGKGGAATPSITEDGDDLVLSIAFVHKTAWNPDPPNEGEDICGDAVISWTPGVYVGDHNIYFGTSIAEVNENASAKVTGWGPNSWDPPGELMMNTSYYWRVDTVNDACASGEWRGGIWSFSTHDGNAFVVFPADEADEAPVELHLVWGACGADAYNVYFSTDFNDVNERRAAADKGSTVETTIDPCSGELSYGSVYYWAIDTVRGGVTSGGEVWSFGTEIAACCAGMRAWYKFDEISGDVAADSSWLEHHGSFAGGANWDPNGGRFGGSVVFNNDSKMEIPFSAAASLSSGVTVSCWLKNANKMGSDNWVFGWGTAEGPAITAAVVLDDGRHAQFRAGNDSNDVLLWDMVRAGLNPATLQDWHHWAFVKSENPPEISIYIDGSRAETNDVVDQSLAELESAVGSVGGVPWHVSDFVGSVDDFRFFDQALSAGDVEGLFRGGEVAKAWKPNPPSGAADVSRNTELSWRSGNYATAHDVYLGLDQVSVRDANSSNSLGVYQQRQPVADGNFGVGVLELGKTYYWRIDEVNEANSPDVIWKGDIWQFTVASYVIIDDFEGYDGIANEIFETWTDNTNNGTGSYVDLASVPFGPAYGGYQSMFCTYNNTSTWSTGRYWSEVELPFDPAMDFTDAGVKVLTLYFYGDPDNDVDDTEELYVGLTGSLSQVLYTTDAGRDMNDLRLAEWTEWNIPISDFAGVDHNAVSSLLIGFGDRDNTSVPGGEGVAYFDDLRLYLPRCVPSLLKPAADVTGDCVVDWGDVVAMGVQWLRSDINVAPVQNPGEANLVGHWQLEGDGGDSSGNNYHGRAEGDYDWIGGKIGSGAIELAGGWVVVDDDGNTPKLRATAAVSAAAWINIQGDTEGDVGIVIKGEKGRETYGLEVNPDGGLSFIVRDSNKGAARDLEGTDELAVGEWIHVGGTYDSNEMTSYVNGQLELSETIGAIELLGDANDGLGIGGRYGQTGDSGRFRGGIDDVRVYDRGLSRAEVAYLASEGTGEVILDSQANLYSGESPEVINIRDVAVLLDSWLVEKFWPWP